MFRFDLYYRKGIVMTYPPSSWSFDKIGQPVEKITVEIPDAFERREDAFGIPEIYSSDGKLCDVYRKANRVFLLMWKKHGVDTTGHFCEVFAKQIGYEKITAKAS